MRGDIRHGLVLAAVLAGVAGGGLAQDSHSVQDKYAVAVQGGLALAECKGYEDWPAVASSQPEEPEAKLNLIVANAPMIAAYRAGTPGNGKPFPDGSRIVKILWNPRQLAEAPFAVKVPGTISSIGCMVKDSARFPDTGGWGYAQFDYDPAADRLVPNTALQGNDAKCGAACHQAAAAKDFVFTEYGRR